MPDAIWIDKSEELHALAAHLATQPQLGLDTEFLRERTFFPKLCLLQLCAGSKVWCIDTLRTGTMAPLLPVLTGGSGTRKLIHAARQDMEALYLVSAAILAPVFDTQIAAACIGMKPQIGYAELVKTLLDVTLPKGQTRTDWARRPLTPEQLRYAADDVLYLEPVAALLAAKLRELGREHWVTEDCLALQERELYEPDLTKSWQRLRGVAQLAPAARGRAKAIANWREQMARERDLPRSWILEDAAIFALANAAPGGSAELQTVQPMNERFAAQLVEVLATAAAAPLDTEPSQDARPTPEQRARADRLARIVDARARELGLSAEVLAPRGELKALAMGRGETPALRGWRREEIGTRLLAALSASG